MTKTILQALKGGTTRYLKPLPDGRTSNFQQESIQAPALLKEFRTGKEHIQTITDFLSCTCPFLTFRREKREKEKKKK